MKVYSEFSDRSDKILLENLRNVEFVSYEEAEIVLCIGDRKEIFELAYKAFIDNKKILHYYGGIVSKYLTTYDDYLRHCIRILADVVWTENKKTAKIVKKIFKLINKKAIIKVVGSNHLIDIGQLDYSKVPNEPYNLILYNNPTKIKEILICPNIDKSYASLPHNQFLALIKECEKFYTNSSAGVYEAPFLIKKDQIIWLGKRNRGRKL